MHRVPLTPPPKLNGRRNFCLCQNSRKPILQHFSYPQFFGLKESYFLPNITTNLLKDLDSANIGSIDILIWRLKKKRKRKKSKRVEIRSSIIGWPFLFGFKWYESNTSSSNCPQNALNSNMNLIPGCLVFCFVCLFYLKLKLNTRLIDNEWLILHLGKPLKKELQEVWKFSIRIFWITGAWTIRFTLKMSKCE